MTWQRHLGSTWLILILAVAMALVPVRASAANERKEVLVLYSMRRDTQIATVGDREMPRLLEHGLSSKVDYNSEYIDAGRFSDGSTRQSSASISR